MLDIYPANYTNKNMYSGLLLYIHLLSRSLRIVTIILYGGDCLLSYFMIGRNVKAARERLSLSQAQVAELLEITTQFYGKIERGEEKPPLDRLAQISELLSVPIESLFAGSLPYMDYKNRPPTDDTEKKIAQILYGCNQERREMILKFASEISRLK